MSAWTPFQTVTSEAENFELLELSNGSKFSLSETS